MRMLIFSLIELRIKFMYMKKNILWKKICGLFIGEKLCDNC